MTTTSDVRLASPEDLDALIGIDFHAYDDDVVPGPGIWRTPLMARGWATLISSSDGVDTGYLVGRWELDARGEFFAIYRCAVRPGFQRRGHCRELLSHLGSGRIRLRLRLHRTIGLKTAVALGFQNPTLLPNWFDNDDAVELWRPPVEG